MSDRRQGITKTPPAASGQKSAIDPLWAAVFAFFFTHAALSLASTFFGIHSGLGFTLAHWGGVVLATLLAYGVCAARRRRVAKD